MRLRWLDREEVMVIFFFFVLIGAGVLLLNHFFMPSAVAAAHLPFTTKAVTPGDPMSYVDTVGQCPFYENVGVKGCVPPADVSCNADWSHCVPVANNVPEPIVSTNVAPAASQSVVLPSTAVKKGTCTE